MQILKAKWYGETIPILDGSFVIMMSGLILELSGELPGYFLTNILVERAAFQCSSF